MRRLLRFATLSIQAAVLSACSPAYDPEEVGTHAWQCPSSGYIVSTADLKGAGLWVFTRNDAWLLKPRGEQWSDGTATLSYAEGSATLTINGAAETCQEDRRASVRESARFRGVDFWGVGNEPPWRLEVSANDVVVYTGYDSVPHRFSGGRPEVDVDRNETVYRAVNETDSLELRILGESCADTMSGEYFDATVRVTLNDERLFGCGTALD